MAFALVAAALLSYGGPVLIQQADAPSKVQCEIEVIHATPGKAWVDPKLRGLERYLTNSFGHKFQRFERIGHGSLKLARRERGKHPLPNDTLLSLTYLGAEKSLLRLTMEVGGMKTRVKVHDGGLFFQAGRRYKKGMLVVAIRAHGVD